MILAFTEEQKKYIELKGMLVIEFKRRLYRMGKTIDDAYHVLKELSEKITMAWSTFIEKFLEAVDGVRLAFEKISEVYHYPTSRRYQIAKVFSKCTGTDISFGWRITWKIKRWLARSCC